MIEKITASPLRSLFETQSKSLMGTDDAPTSSFIDMLKETMQKLNQSQIDADVTIQSFLKGDITDTHKVMLALEKADLSLRTALQFKNKVVAAYEEIMRMQV